MDRLIEKREIADLLDVYGELLTDRQRSFLDLYYNEDFSYGEIAETESISRQAVHDAIQHGKKSLLHFEEHLNLAKQRRREREDASFLPVGPEEWEEIRRLIWGLHQDLRQEDILFDTQPLRNKVKDLLKRVGLLETT